MPAGVLWMLGIGAAAADAWKVQSTKPSPWAALAQLRPDFKGKQPGAILPFFR